MLRFVGQRGLKSLRSRRRSDRVAGIDESKRVWELSDRGPASGTSAADISTSTDAVYTSTFWLAYAANVVLVAANALTFRFAELVSLLGGNEEVAGDIVSFGLIVAVAIRLAISHLIDDWGTRRFWSLMTFLFFAGSVVFFTSSRLGWEIYIARASFMTGLTGMFACSMTHIQNQVPPHRRTEAIGNLGSSGFLGMIVGSNLGDWWMRSLPDRATQFRWLFTGPMALSMVYLAIVLIITHGQDRGERRKSPPAYQLLLRHWPGGVVVVAMIMGLGVTVTTVFLTRFATRQGISGIGLFFTGYALSAFIFRISVRNWSRSIGRHWMLVRGLCGHAIGHALLPFVTQDWQFVVPAIICGFGHALLYPAVVSLGSGAYPADARGSGTASILAIVDMGSLLFAALLGRVIVYAGFPQMFWTSAGVAGSVAIWYAVIAIRHPDPEAAPRQSAATVIES